MLKIQKNIFLSNHTTFKTGGRALFFVRVKNLEELRESIGFARKNKLKVFLLGGGSNVVFSDKGFHGLVIKIEIKGISLRKDGDNLFIYAGAGERWDNVVALAVSDRWRGIENLSLIPGTVGGAVYQNIGAYGVEIKDSINYVFALNIKTGRKVKIRGAECKFGYRTSLFQESDNFVILGVELKLSKKKSFNLNYPNLGEYFKNKEPDIKKIRQAIIKIRKSKIPYPTSHMGTAGSFFKNPVIKKDAYKTILKKYPDIRGRESGGMIKLSAGQLIEMAGWKGKRIDNAGVSEKHALVLVSYPGGKSKDIIKLSESIKKSVRVKFGVSLEAEVKIVS